MYYNPVKLVNMNILTVKKCLELAEQAKQYVFTMWKNICESGKTIQDQGTKSEKAFTVFGLF